MNKLLTSFLIILNFTQGGCQNSVRNTSQASSSTPTAETASSSVVVGAAQLDIVLPILKDKRVALVVNYTAVVGNEHLADTLKKCGITIKKILAPEHGFRGNAANGEYVRDGVDLKTGLQVVSLYGNNKKPTGEQLADVDVVVFDIQDVGVRFFTYIGTMHYVMEACAEHGKKLIILDRPNPNGSYVDGPVLQPEFKSFIGMHPVPVVHGLTVGEYARMINGEGWLAGKRKCEIEVVKLKNWNHQDSYAVPIRPSPNLPNDQAIRLYPSICFFEGTVLSLGRGTQTPFQVIGHPDLKNMPYQFTPITIEGMAKNPPQENKICYGLDLTKVPVKQQIALHYLLDMYKAFPDKEKFFIPFFERLAGNAVLRQQIKEGLTEDEIRKTWEVDLNVFKQKRMKYLLYP